VSWSTPADLKAQLLRAWERGDLLRAAMGKDENAFPWRLALKCPASADLTDRFDAVRSWTAELSAAPHVRMEWQEVRHRVQGRQRVPAQAWIDSLEDAFEWLGVKNQAKRFLLLVDSTRRACPDLLGWVGRYPQRALQLAGDWPRLLAVVEWLRAHPRPGIYLRQVDLPGIHTKFIESHRGVLTELLDLALPPGSVDASKTGVAQFTARFGFLDKPVRLRFRILDRAIIAAPGTVNPDMALDAASFSRLCLPVRRIFITENETNFLAFPPVPGAIVMFGAGYGWAALAQAAWLNNCVVHYWGDIDTHGFAILNQLRTRFAHVESLLMDRATLEAHAAFCTSEPDPSRATLDHLTGEERSLYEDLRTDSLGKALRLEQEFVRYGWLMDRLQALTGATSQS
jgi:hypothetical protein